MDKRQKRTAAFALTGCLACLAAASAAAAAEPPKVIELDPPHQSTELDPNTTEIRVTFDRDMNTRGFSFCGGGPQFPKMRGRPKWINKRTVVVKVRLEPEHRYQMSLNCPAANNFTAQDGTPLQPTPWSFSTGSKLGRIEQRDLNRKSLEELMEVLTDEYSYRDRKQIDWKKLERKYRKRLANAKTTRKWVATVAKMLRPAEDLHLWMDFGGTATATHRRKLKPNMTMDGLKAVLPNLAQRNRTVWTARTDDDIAYLLIASWSVDRTEDLQTVHSILEESGSAKALILDVRPNSGGDESLAKSIAAWFVDGQKTYAKNAYRDRHSKTGFGKTLSRTIQGNDPPRRYQRPVFVLMGPANMSSCEAFLLMMKQGRDVKLVGQTSFGSSGNPKPHELANRVTIYVPSWKALRPDGTPFEGQGIAPDIEVKAPSRQFRTGDPVLQRALKELRERLGTATDRKKTRRP